MQSFLVDENGLPFLNNTYRNFPAVSQFGEGTTIDTDLSAYIYPRVDYAVGRFNIPFLDWDVPTSHTGYIRNVNYGGIYFAKKQLPSHADRGSRSLTSTGTSSTKNVHLVRYADVLLWYAEALINTGNPAGARLYVNKVRERAANSYVKAAKMSGPEGETWGTVMTEIPSPYVLDNKFDGTTNPNSAANYSLGPWHEYQFVNAEDAIDALILEYNAEFSMEGSSLV